MTVRNQNYVHEEVNNGLNLEILATILFRISEFPTSI